MKGQLCGKQFQLDSKYVRVVALPFTALQFAIRMYTRMCSAVCVIACEGA